MKLPRKWAAVVIAIGVIGAGSPAAHADPTDPVSIPDMGLRSCMARAIGVEESASYTEEQISRIQSLYCRDVDSLVGLEHATALVTLSISSGHLADLSPLRTSALRSIYLSGTVVTDLGPLASAAQLETFFVEGGVVSDLRPLSGLARLSTLRIDSNALSDVSALSALNLTTLQLRGTHVSDLKPIGQIESLIDLDLSAGAITDITALGRLRNLGTLDLSTNAITDITALGKLRKLRSLILDDNRVVDVGPLARSDQLRQIALRNNRISDAAPLGPAYRRGAGVSLDGNRVADLRAFNTLDGYRLYAPSQTFRSSVRAQAGIPAEVPAHGVASPTQPLILSLPPGATTRGSKLLYRSPGTYTIHFSQSTEMEDLEVPNIFLVECFTGTFIQVVTAATAISPASPMISGTSRVGARLIASTGSWYPKGVTLKYQWLRGNAAIPRATASTYTPTASDRGRRIAVSVTGTYPRLAPVIRTSLPTRRVAAGILGPQTPTISGQARKGKTLRLATKAWKPTGVKLSYRWLRAGHAIKGATGTAYKITGKDRSKRLSVRVTGRKDGYVTLSRTSRPTRSVR